MTNFNEGAYSPDWLDLLLVNLYYQLIEGKFLLCYQAGSCDFEKIARRWNDS